MNNTSAINPNTKPAIQAAGLQRLCRGELSNPRHNHQAMLLDQQQQQGEAGEKSLELFARTRAPGKASASCVLNNVALPAPPRDNSSNSSFSSARVPRAH